MPVNELYLVEVRTRDRAALARWYGEALGLATILDDPAGDYTLMAAGSAHLAIKGGRAEAASGSIVLAFRVDDVEAERSRLLDMGVAVTEPADSPEGYRVVRLTDPAGHPIRLFAWVG